MRKVYLNFLEAELKLEEKVWKGLEMALSLANVQLVIICNKCGSEIDVDNYSNHLAFHLRRSN